MATNVSLRDALDDLQKLANIQRPTITAADRYVVLANMAQAILSFDGMGYTPDDVATYVDRLERQLYDRTVGI